MGLAPVLFLSILIVPCAYTARVTAIFNKFITMKHTIEIDCPPEILMGLHLDAQRFGELIKLQAATALFGQGKLSSGMAARWCNLPRVHFLLQAMQAGAHFLDNNEDDFVRETSLL